jgi:hypothetical protein
MLEKLAQGRSSGLVNFRVLKSPHHMLHPCGALPRADLEAKMGFAQAHPEPALRVRNWPSEELRQKRDELFDRALHRLSRE